MARMTVQCVRRAEALAKASALVTLLNTGTVIRVDTLGNRFDVAVKFRSQTLKPAG